MENTSDETALFIACESGDLQRVKELLKAVDPSSLSKYKTSEGRTCLHVAVIEGNGDILKILVDLAPKAPGLVAERDNHGDTALHLALRKFRVDLVKLLIDYKPVNLCDCVNKNGETPLCLAVKFGFFEVVKEIIISKPHSVQIPSENKNVLHFAVELNQVKIVDFLTETENIDLSQLINQGYHEPPANPPANPPVEGSVKPSPPPNPLVEGGVKPNLTEGDTPLHIAARKKYVQMVGLLLRVKGVKKNALNSDGLTPLDIAREVTEYHESYKIIAKLTDYPRGSIKPFMYNAPTVSQKKHDRSRAMVDKAFHDRHNAELVVAALLATMTFTAAFTVPGGFLTEPKNGEPLGSPALINYNSFKLFLIFDCVAFFLSLFVVYMWQMSSELSTGDKMFFMCVNNVLVCLTFAFTAYGFMAAIYAVLAHRVKTLSWVVLGNLIFICLCGNLAFMYKISKFAVARARLHRLCGVPRLADDVVENMWCRAERVNLLEFFRSRVESLASFLSGLNQNVTGDSKIRNLLCCLSWREGKQTTGGSGGGGGGGDGHGSRSSSPFLNERGSAQPPV